MACWNQALSSSWFSYAAFLNVVSPVEFDVSASANLLSPFAELQDRWPS
jgi:hypothetical protein